MRESRYLVRWGCRLRGPSLLLSCFLVGAPCGSRLFCASSFCPPKDPMISTRDIGVSADAALNGKAAGCTPQGTRERMEVKAFGATFGMTPAVRGWLALALVLTVAGCRSEEHTSELQSLMRISSAVFCLKKKQKKHVN